MDYILENWYHASMTIDEIKEKARPILQKHRITRAAVLGSVDRGEDTPQSDIDILVDIPHIHGLFEFLSIKHELEDALGKKVDLIEYAGIKKSIKESNLSSQSPIL